MQLHSYESILQQDSDVKLNISHNVAQQQLVKCLNTTFQKLQVKRTIKPGGRKEMRCVVTK